MDELAVDFRALEDVERAMREAVIRVDVLLDDLARYLQPLVKTWTGAASERYQEARRDWEVAMADQQRQLADLHALLVNAHQNHHTAVRTNKRIWAV